MNARLNAPAAAVRGTRKRIRENSLLAQTAIHLFFIAACAACLIPLILVTIVSFTDERSILANGYSFLPEAFSLDAYRYLLADSGRLLHAYGISILVTVAGTLASLLISSLLAYPLSRRDFAQRHLLAFFVFFTILFNGGLVPWYLVYTNLFHLKDTLLALLVPNLLMNGFYILIMRTFFSNSIPGSLIESAQIDGAGEWRTFFRIVFPLSLPVLATIGLFTTLGYWNDWFNSLVFIYDNRLISLQYLMTKTLLSIQFLQSNTQNSNVGKLLSEMPTETVRMAMAIVGIGPIVLAYPFFQKYLVKGLTVGAVKG
ncbi:carbohydrate ABC transporter permease [Cohnella sp. LGH]|uniref:Putative aldouronate transport system permease protein n=1 Tax=Cohnella phaseoli TaxID=456490 RepID=A0A3D9JQK5_9BACL|nr:MULTISPECIES: carbohydrate ABC transporter permease [Cohnella]QTH44487.1 carbohydrate ABC transporter permease [Cohnella sp. LGH]RED76391.1 putative aldouronate transport system permease protein [Cohnella phaseoli]